MYWYLLPLLPLALAADSTSTVIVGTVTVTRTTTVPYSSTTPTTSSIATGYGPAVGVSPVPMPLPDFSSEARSGQVSISTFSSPSGQPDSPAHTRGSWAPNTAGSVLPSNTRPLKQIFPGPTEYTPPPVYGPGSEDGHPPAYGSPPDLSMPPKKSKPGYEQSTLQHGSSRSAPPLPSTTSSPQLRAVTSSAAGQPAAVVTVVTTATGATTVFASNTFSFPSFTVHAADAETSSQSLSAVAETSCTILDANGYSTSTSTIVLTQTTTVAPDPAYASVNNATPAYAATFTTAVNPLPLNVSAVEICLTSPGGVQADGNVTAGCGAIFAHVESCYEALMPWTDPYSAVQSVKFQTCLCETSAINPFNVTSPLWRNFTGCTNCLLTVDTGIEVDVLASEFQNIENFCCSQQPNAFLAIAQFEVWLQKLNEGLILTAPPLTGPITQVTSLAPVFSTVPPLANLAWGPSAPFDGSLVGVTPELTTRTVTVSGTGKPELRQITELVQWVPTAASGGTSGSYNSASASIAAASIAESNLQGALSSLAAMGQGGPQSQVCHGPCVKPGAAASTEVAVWGAAAVVLLTVALLL